MALLSVIVPCFNEEENVHYFYEELMKNQTFFDKKELDVEVSNLNGIEIKFDVEKIKL